MRAWLEIDCEAIRHNLEVISRQIGTGVDIIAVIKSDAYALGLDKIGKVLNHIPQVSCLAVISLEEAILARRVSAKPILILGYLDYRELQQAIEAGFMLSLYDRELVATIERLAARLNKVARVHLKVDTGLNRLGVPADQAADVLQSRRLFPHLQFKAIFSHLAEADQRSSNLAQLRRLQDLLIAVQDKGELLPIHLVSSAALSNFPEGYFDAVRIGQAIYGWRQILPDLRLAIRAKSVIAQIKEIPAGETIGYDRTFRTSRPLKIGLMAMGYGEGLPTALSSGGEVLVAGSRRKILGKISMNFAAVDLTGLEVSRGEEVVIIGQQANRRGEVRIIEIEDLAKQSGLRHHEIVVNLGRSLPKIYIGEASK